MTTSISQFRELFQPDFLELFDVFSAVHEYPTAASDIMRDTHPMHPMTVAHALEELEELGLILVHHESAQLIEWRLA